MVYFISKWRVFFYVKQGGGIQMFFSTFYEGSKLQNKKVEFCVFGVG
jgi:hypothetical protein